MRCQRPPLFAKSSFLDLLFIDFRIWLAIWLADVKLCPLVHSRRCFCCFEIRLLMHKITYPAYLLFRHHPIAPSPVLILDGSAKFAKCWFRWFKAIRTPIKISPILETIKFTLSCLINFGLSQRIVFHWKSIPTAGPYVKFWNEWVEDKLSVPRREKTEWVNIYINEIIANKLQFESLCEIRMRGQNRER